MILGCSGRCCTGRKPAFIAITWLSILKERGKNHLSFPLVVLDFLVWRQVKIICCFHWWCLIFWYGGKLVFPGPEKLVSSLIVCFVFMPHLFFLVVFGLYCCNFGLAVDSVREYFCILVWSQVMAPTLVVWMFL